jgi:lysophospholipase-1
LGSGHAASLPIFWGHGGADGIVTLALAQQSRDFLTKELGIKETSEPGKPGLSFNVYRGVEHTFDTGQEMADFEKWLGRVVPAV